MCYSYSIKVSLICDIANFKQNMMIAKSKPSQWLGAVPLDPRTYDLLIGIGIPPEKFLPKPLMLAYLI